MNEPIQKVLPDKAIIKHCLHTNFSTIVGDKD
jgi:hypothetical protein